jgi:tetratricopeptide (TPR) repeat protein
MRGSKASSIAAALLAVALLLLPGCDTTQQQRINKGKENLKEAQKLRDQGLTEAALAAFNAALKENPSLVEAQMGVGDIYRQKGDYQSAADAYEKATVVAPMSFDAHYYLGLMRQLLGKVPEAVEAYLRAVTIKPNDFDANANLASAYLQLGRPADALPYARRAADLKTEDQGAWANLALIYNMLGQYGNAVDAYRRAAELGTVGEPILLGLADAHIKLGNYDRAGAVLQTLLRRNPSAAAYERLGYSQFKQRRFDDALASFRAALSLDPNDTASLNGLGVCLMTLYIQGGRQVPEQREQAIDAWRKSLQAHPDQPRIIDLMSRYQKI